MEDKGVLRVLSRVLVRCAQDVDGRRRDQPR